MSSNLRNALKNIPKVLLTATPIQNSMNDLYSLAAMIDEYFPITSGRIPDNTQSLRSRWEPLLVRNLRKDSTVNFVHRITKTKHFELNDAEKTLYDAVNLFLQKDNLNCMNQGNRQLVKMTLRRLLASCPSNLAITLERLKKRLLRISRVQRGDLKPEPSMTKDEIDYLEQLVIGKGKFKNKLSDAEIKELHNEINELEHLRQLAEKTQSISKSEALVYVLKEGLKAVVENGGNRKAVIFTEFLETQKHISEMLNRVPEFKRKTVMINGSNTNPQAEKIYRSWFGKNRKSSKSNPNLDRKTAILGYFEHSADILIATDAAGEGLNLQFCSLLVNYDLPWNPQRIEQRIGRCHRYGQKNDVAVVNFMNLDNHAEKRLLELLNAKLELFHNVLGFSNEIVGTVGEDKEFEKWVVEVFLQCRTQDEIDKAIDEKLESMNTKPDIQLDESWQGVSHIFQHSYPDIATVIEANRMKLWQIVKKSYAGFASFSDNTMTFEVKNKLLFTYDSGIEYELPKGKYSLRPNSPRKGFKYLEASHLIIQGALREFKEEQIEGINRISLRLRLPKGATFTLPEKTFGAIRVIHVKGKCHYEYEKIIYAGYFVIDGKSQLMSEDSIRFLLENSSVVKRKKGRPRHYPDRRSLNKIISEALDKEKDFLQREYDNHINRIRERLDNWTEKKLNLLRSELISMQKGQSETNQSKHAQLKFEQTWQQYRNDVAELEHKKELTIQQSIKQYSPKYTTEDILTVSWYN